MKSISTIVLGAGQTGLAMSHCLSQRNIDHVVLEKAEVANAWRHERWDSLRLLTPNWQSRLPGFAEDEPDPDGFMAASAFGARLLDYAQTLGAPIEEHTHVHAVSASSRGYRIDTNRGVWDCQSLVLATGACNRSLVPGFASDVPVMVDQLTAHDYRGPGQLAAGDVLVVGGSASGAQLALEIAEAGHGVTLSVGAHIRVPRFYRGKDIQRWMDMVGLYDTRADEVDDIERARGVPSFQLVGSNARQFLDLNALQAAGVEIVGRMVGVRDGKALFSGSLANHCAMSDLKMNRLLTLIDEWVAENAPDLSHPVERFAPTRVPALPNLSADLGSGQFKTVIWATGYGANFNWLHLPVFDRKGRLAHQAGIVAPNLYTLGLPFTRRRNSALIAGAGRDAHDIAELINTKPRRKAA